MNIARVFLSPSTQEYNPYINGAGSEESVMNELTDKLIPYLQAAGISYGRNDPNGTVIDSVALSNSGNYGLHLALHSNASPESLAGQLRGIDVYYYDNSYAGRQIANLFASYLKQIYPLPDNVTTRGVTNLYELRATRAPAILIELGYHDNIEDANWIVNNLDAIAAALAHAIADFFGIPFVQPR